MGFSNQSIKAIDPLKPHICKREGLWRVSPYDWKKLWSKGISVYWNLAHQYANNQNDIIRAEQEAAKERQREWKRLEQERELLAKEDLTAYENEILNSQWGN